MVKWILSVLVVFVVAVVAVDANADCNGRSAPVGNQRVSIVQKIRAARAASCSSGERVAASCSGPVQAASCSQSVMSAAPAPEPAYEVFLAPTQVLETKSAPTFVIEAAAPVCENGRCDVVRNAVTAPVRIASIAYQQALASAQYRAANRIHGHSYLDTHRTSGVGWATSDSQPVTCLGRGGDSYAVARGPDGWYATKFR